ncbi:hypothetical protein C7M84_008841 [Penaeus vannamei]|uniref:Uncharacterized protein n=1 Tax=Penaeus vannamei TaxID=6689 RepID=A0A3R7QN30_PENVA|nr:hypothetical protein C7M84_008841 [Penaeus vannamei]
MVSLVFPSLAFPSPLPRPLTPPPHPSTPSLVRKSSITPVCCFPSFCHPLPLPLPPLICLKPSCPSPLPCPNLPLPFSLFRTVFAFCPTVALLPYPHPPARALPPTPPHLLRACHPTTPPCYPTTPTHSHLLSALLPCYPTTLKPLLTSPRRRPSPLLSSSPLVPSLNHDRARQRRSFVQHHDRGHLRHRSREDIEGERHRGRGHRGRGHRGRETSRERDIEGEDIEGEDIEGEITSIRDTNPQRAIQSPPSITLNHPAINPPTDREPHSPPPLRTHSVSQDEALLKAPAEGTPSAHRRRVTLLSRRPSADSEAPAEESDHPPPTRQRNRPFLPHTKERPLSPSHKGTAPFSLTQRNQPFLPHTKEPPLSPSHKGTAPFSLTRILRQTISETLVLHLHFPFLPMILPITDTSEAWDVFTLHLASIKGTAVTSAVISSCCLSLSLLAYDEFR